jgi:hypothetical protein
MVISTKIGVGTNINWNCNCLLNPDATLRNSFKVAAITDSGSGIHILNKYTNHRSALK